MKKTAVDCRMVRLFLCVFSMLIISYLIISHVGYSYSIVGKKKTGIMKNTVNPPQFSCPSGYYDKPLNLEINVPEGIRVYYTLDCTVPDTSSMRYEAPVYLDNPSDNDNVYSDRTDISVAFNTDFVNKYSLDVPGIDYRVPDFPVDKCNVVRAVAYDRWGNRSEVATASYFIGLDESYKSIKTASVVTEPENLFNYEHGIYVTGKVFEEYTHKTRYYRDWKLWTCNYRKRGSKWEREAHFELIDQNIPIISQDVGIRTQGGATRAFACKSLNIFAREKYDGTGYFETNPFNKDYKISKLTISNGGNRRLTRISDKLMSDTVPDLSFAVMNYQPCILFLDGEYWGFMWLAEPYTSEYISSSFDVDDKNIIMIKNGKVEIGDQKYLDAFHKMKYEITHRDMTDAVQYEYACSLVDVDNFIDYYAAQAYIARRNDWPKMNYALWRTVYSEDSEYGDTRWRWMLFDSNSAAMAGKYLQDNTLEYIIKHDSLFAAFWKNEDFRQAFKKRIYEIADRNFNSVRMQNYIENFDHKWFPYLKNTWMKYEGDKEEDYNMEMEDLKYFYVNRKNVIHTWFDQE